MKAVLALVIIYVGTFFLVIQGASQNSVQASPQGSGQGNAVSRQASPSIDPAKEADIRSLMELVGARDLVQDGENAAIEQSREKLLSTVPNNDKGQAFVNAFAASYQKKFDVDQVTDQLVEFYDKHFTDDEIKGLLQFYGSPLGQKVAAEMPKISRETQAAIRTANAKAAKDALAELKRQSPEIGQSARLGNGPGQGRWQQRRATQRGPGQGSQQAAAHEQDPRQFEAQSQRSAFSLLKALFDFYVYAERPVLIAQSDNGHIAIHVVLHLNHLLLRRAHVRNVSNGEVAGNLLFDRHARRCVLFRTRRAHSSEARINAKPCYPKQTLEASA